MNSWLKLGGQGVRFCGRCLLGLVCWTLWLGLGLVLALEIWIATSHELAVPAFVLREFEQRLAVSHVSVKFGHARFDPAGRVLVDDVRVLLPAFGEPVITTRAAYVEIDPWALLAGRFEPRSVRLTGASLAVPAMLSSSGQAEAIVLSLDGTFRPREHELVIEHLTAAVAGFAVAIHGAVHLAPPPPGAKVEPLPVADLLASHYPDLCRQLVRLGDQLAALDQPQLSVELTPSESRGAIAEVTMLARGLKLEAPVALQATGLRLTTRFPIQGEAPVMAPLNLAVDDLQLAGGLALHAVRARLRGALQPARYTYEPREVLVSASGLAAPGFNFTALSARLEPGPLPRVAGEVLAECAGSLLAVRGRADLAQKTAALRFDAVLAPALLGPIGAALHADLRPYLGLGAPTPLSVDLALDPGWRFAHATGRFAVRHLDAYHVPIDAGRAEFEFDGRYFTAHHAFARLGENFARGSFFNDFETGEHRFLLEGRLRPLAISPWLGKWWPAFFKDYDFPVAPPDASVDVKGNWHGGRRNTVFVYADSTAPVIHGVKFDHARALLFIRPNFYDGLEVFATIGSGSARGTFVRQVELSNFDLISLDLDFDSTLELDVPGRIFGPMVADVLAPYWFAQPPTVKFLAHFDGSASPDGQHQVAQITAQSLGAFTFHDFPLSNLSFHAVVHDDEVTLDPVEAGFAGGIARGRARVWGRDAARRVGFDLTLQNASLGLAKTTLDAYLAKRQGLPAPAPGKSDPGKASVRLDLAASAEGGYDDLYSYHGSGNASLSGETLGQIRLFGLLSELLSFTSLRFTEARAAFKIEGPKLNFSQFNVTGANSAIAAHGTYALDRSELDFKGRVNPFQESSFIPTALLGAFLTPFSSMFEVKLTGSLEKPAWAFVNGPTNFFRNLSRPATVVPPKTPASQPDYLRR